MTGLRAGEMHALRWHHLDLDKGEVRVETRVDEFGEEDVTKTVAGMRVVPLGAGMIAALQDWQARAAHPKSTDLVFPGRYGGYQNHGSLVRKRFYPLFAAMTVAALRRVPIGPRLTAILARWRPAGATPDDLVFPSEQGTPRGYPNIANRHLAPLQIALNITAIDGSPRWTAHSFRHFAVSLWIDEGASLKQVAEWAGHETPEFTQRVYGHLFERGRRDIRPIVAGELSVLGPEPAELTAQPSSPNAGNPPRQEPR